MFENKTYEGIHYSRFVASWLHEVCKSTKPLKKYHFREWLESLTINDKPIPNDIISEIFNFATNGKLELETNAMMFINRTT